MIKFLNKETILAFHQDLIKQYRGKQGIRDEELLESILAEPQASYGGEYVSIFELAAIYGFLICIKHPFIDGNNRTSLVATLTFLYVNGYRLQVDNKSLFKVIFDLAGRIIGKKELTEFLEKNTEEVVE